MAWCWDGALFQGVVDGQKRLNLRGCGGGWVVVKILADSLMWGRFLRGCMESKRYLKVYVPPIPLPPQVQYLALPLGLTGLSASIIKCWVCLSELGYIEL